MNNKVYLLIASLILFALSILSASPHCTTVISFILGMVMMDFIKSDE